MLPLTSGHQGIDIFRHALALDERRVKFLPEYVDTTAFIDDNYERVKEVWFAGSHSDIGGGNVDNMKLNNGSESLIWMRNEAEIAGLVLTPNPLGDGARRRRVHESLTFSWWGLELFPIARKSYGSQVEGKTRQVSRRGRQIPVHHRIHRSVLAAHSSSKVEGDEYEPRATFRPKEGNKRIVWKDIFSEDSEYPSGKNYLKWEGDIEIDRILELVTDFESYQNSEAIFFWLIQIERVVENEALAAMVWQYGGLGFLLNLTRLDRQDQIGRILRKIIGLPIAISGGVVTGIIERITDLLSSQQLAPSYDSDEESWIVKARLCLIMHIVHIIKDLAMKHPHAVLRTSIIECTTNLIVLYTHSYSQKHYTDIMIHLFGIFENLLHLEDDRIRDLAMYQCLQPDIMQIVVNSLSGEPSVASAALDMIEWWMKRRKYLENLSPLVANLSLELNQLLLYGKDGALVKKSIRIVGFTAQEGTFLCRLPKGSFAVTDPSSHGKHWGDQFTLNIWRLYFEPIYQEDVIRATKALLAIASDNIRGHLYQQNIVEALKELVESNLDVVVIFGLMARDEPARIELIEKEIAHKMINSIDNNKLAEDRLSIRNAIIELCSPVVQTTLPESSRVHGFVQHVMKVVTQKLHDCTATQDCYGIVKRVLSNIKIPIVGVFDLSSNMDDLKALLTGLHPDFAEGLSGRSRLGKVSLLGAGALFAFVSAEGPFRAVVPR
ncbi:WD40 repeat protein [Ceratobasidium sp. AG-Ba]|nr:WD40 repeat protein [Ceratobasidium sp. AG-Ba]